MQNAGASKTGVTICLILERFSKQMCTTNSTVLVVERTGLFWKGYHDAAVATISGCCSCSSGPLSVISSYKSLKLPRTEIAALSYFQYLGCVCRNPSLRSIQVYFWIICGYLTSIFPCVPSLCESMLDRLHGPSDLEQLA